MTATAVRNITWLDPASVEAYACQNQSPLNPYAAGYGRKIPTRFTLRIAKRWHRVYAMCYSNVATFYVLKSGAELILDNETEYVLEAYSRGEVPSEEVLTTIRRFDTHHGGRTSDPLKEES